jgi:hypothetical protein
MKSQDSSPPTRLRIWLFCSVVVVIACGLALRRYGYGLGWPFPVVKYGGSVLWGSMVYLLLAVVVANPRSMRVVWLSLVIVMVVEFFRLVHFPALDSFRMTAAGALLLGRVFSFWNIAAYFWGIGVARFVQQRFLSPEMD